MATYDWPASFYPTSMEWGNRKAGLQFESPHNGSTQALVFPNERWLLNLALPPKVWADAGAVEAFFERLSGGVNRVRVYHRTRPVPVGTMRGTPTVQVAAARGNATLTIGTTAGATLKSGDLFKVANQLFKTADDCVANGSGLIVVPLVHRVRYAIGTGAAVAWDRPTAEFVMLAMGSSMSYSAAVSNPVTVDLQEIW